MALAKAMYEAGPAGAADDTWLSEPAMEEEDDEGEEGGEDRDNKGWKDEDLGWEDEDCEL